MKKTFLLLAAVVALNVWADAPTASVASVQIYYCTPESASVAVTCEEESYTWQGTTFTKDTVCTKVLINKLGCDSTVQLTLTFKKTYYFTVASGKQVVFSPGNLQYKASQNGTACDVTHTTKDSPECGVFRFAEHQWDMIGSANSNISATYTGWIDIFGYGTSCGLYDKTRHYPYQSSQISADYAYNKDNSSYADLSVETQLDWGVYNTSLEGATAEKPWRTLTSSEWSTLIGRDSKAKCGLAVVNDVNGMVLLPDTWNLPDGCTFNKISSSGSPYNQNVYTNNAATNDWLKMEAAGAVFLPAAGSRQGTTFYDNGGYYWSTTPYNASSGMINIMCFWNNSENKPEISTTNCYKGSAVRLVKDK